MSLKSDRLEIGLSIYEADRLKMGPSLFLTSNKENKHSLHVGAL